MKFYLITFNQTFDGEDTYWKEIGRSPETNQDVLRLTAWKTQTTADDLVTLDDYIYCYDIGNINFGCPEMEVIPEADFHVLAKYMYETDLGHIPAKETAKV